MTDRAGRRRDASQAGRPSLPLTRGAADLRLTQRTSPLSCSSVIAITGGLSDPRGTCQRGTSSSAMPGPMETAASRSSRTHYSTAESATGSTTLRLNPAAASQRRSATDSQLATTVLFFVTPHYLENKGWRRLEANAATARLAHDPRAACHPCSCSAAQRSSAARFPLLADRVALAWDPRIPTVADAVARLFPRNAATEWHTFHPEETVGRVWARLLPVPDEVGKLTT